MHLSLHSTPVRQGKGRAVIPVAYGWIERLRDVAKATQSISGGAGN